MKKLLFLITLALSAQHILASSEAPAKKDPFARYKDNPELLAIAKLFAICNGSFDEQTFHDAMKFEWTIPTTDFLVPERLEKGIRFIVTKRHGNDVWEQKTIELETVFGTLKFGKESPSVEDIQKSARTQNVLIENTKKNNPMGDNNYLFLYDVTKVADTPIPASVNTVLKFCRDRSATGKENCARIIKQAKEAWNLATMPTTPHEKSGGKESVQ